MGAVVVAPSAAWAAVAVAVAVAAVVAVAHPLPLPGSLVGGNSDQMDPIEAQLAQAHRLEPLATLADLRATQGGPRPSLAWHTHYWYHRMTAVARRGDCACHYTVVSVVEQRREATAAAKGEREEASWQRAVAVAAVVGAGAAAVGVGVDIGAAAAAAAAAKARAAAGALQCCSMGYSSRREEGGEEDGVYSSVRAGTPRSEESRQGVEKNTGYVFP